jgi:hypothetical protein
MRGLADMYAHLDLDALYSDPLCAVCGPSPMRSAPCRMPKSSFGSSKEHGRAGCTASAPRSAQHAHPFVLFPVRLSRVMEAARGAWEVGAHGSIGSGNR